MKDGFYTIKSFLSEKELSSLDAILGRFHEKWKSDNKEVFEEKGAVNSAYLTSSATTSTQDRLPLFKLITSPLINNELKKNFKEEGARFLNTQLFFDPFEANRRNYWHRDIQYTGLSLEEQRKEIAREENNVIHFRVALRDEKGVELIPGSHNRWDNDLEYNTRHALEGCHSYDNLPNSEVIDLKRGDLLIFCANMIHRGLYGGDRFAFDILYCENDPEILKYTDPKCFPTDIELKELKNQYLLQRNEFSL